MQNRFMTWTDNELLQSSLSCTMCKHADAHENCRSHSHTLTLRKHCKKMKTDYSNKYMQHDNNDNITPVMSLLSCCIHVGVCFVFTGADYVHMKFPSAELQLLQDAMTQNVQDVAPPPLPILTHRTNYPHSTAFKCSTSIQH